MTEAATSLFAMHGARDAIAHGLIHIEQQVKSIELAVVENPGLAFDLARTLVESVCRSVLSERAIRYADEDDLPKLFKLVTNSLPFLPVAASSESDVRKSLVQTLGGLHSAVQGICELRNRCGFASHGSEASRPVMESVQALLAAEAADTIVGFIYRVHRQPRPEVKSFQLNYGDNPRFNEVIDELHPPVRIFDERFEPSRILFEMAPEPYRVYLAGFESEQDKTEMGATSGDQTGVEP